MRQDEKKNLFSFDVESIGVHGEPFAYGYVVVDMASGRELENGGAYMPSGMARGERDDREWALENVSTAILRKVPRWEELAKAFAADWSRWSGSSLMMADCPVPVEAGFLIAARRVADFEFPYPLLDVESVRSAAGMTCEDAGRTPDELPAHHPIRDARQSARLWVEITR